MAINSLSKLRELTKNLVSWQPEAIHEDYIDVRMEKGISKIYKLMYEPSIAVSKVFIAKDSDPGMHIHAQKEFIILYKGKVRMETTYFKKTLAVGDSMYINAGEPHTALALEDSWLIATTIPASEVFPQ